MIKKLILVLASILALLMIIFISNNTVYDILITKLSDMPTKRQEIAAVELNDKFYVIGGIDDNRKATNVVEIYDPKNNKWAKSEYLPKKLHHVAAINLNDKIYAIGGFISQDEKFVAVNDVFEFDGSKWLIKKHMPTARGALGLAVYKDKLYAIGGNDGKSSLSITQIYDTIKDEWKNASSMSLKRDHLYVVELNGKIYSIGGRINDKWPFTNLGEIETYHPEEDSWEILNVKIKPRSGMAAAKLSNQIYLFGGESNIQVFSDFEEFDPIDKKIRKLRSKLIPRHGAAAIGYGNRIYILGGALKAGFGATNITEYVAIV